MAIFCWGYISHAYQVHWIGDHIDAHGPGSCILEQSCREHGRPHHLNGALTMTNSGGMSVTTWGRLSPCRDHVISANPGRGDGHQWMVSSCLGSTSWAAAAAWLAIWAVVLACNCFLPWTPENDPLTWALQVLLWLHSLGVGSAILEDIILTQLEGGTLSRTHTSVNVVRDSITHLSSCTLSASWQASPRFGGWAFSTQCWRAFA